MNLKLSNQTIANLRRIAIQNITSDSIEVFIEKCYRHYSKTYHTPLHIAKQELTLPEVVLIYLEDELEEMTPDEIQELKTQLDISPKPVLEASNPYEEENKEISDDEWLANQERELKAKEEKLKMDDVIKKTHEAIDKFKTHIVKHTESENE